MKITAIELLFLAEKKKDLSEPLFLFLLILFLYPISIPSSKVTLTGSIHKYAQLVMLTHYSPTHYFSECGYSCCTLYFSEGGFGAYTVHERPAWAPDDADVMNADMPRCIGKIGHALGCVVLDHIRCELIAKWVSGETPSGIFT